MNTNPQRGRDRSHATWVWRVFWAFVLLAICAVIGPLLLGCAPAEPAPTNSPRPPTTARTAEQPAPAPASKATAELCDAVVQNYRNDRLPLEDTRAALVEAAKAPGVNGAVRRAVLDTLYAGGGLPTRENVTARYDVVLDACRSAGWVG